MIPFQQNKGKFSLVYAKGILNWVIGVVLDGVFNLSIGTIIDVRCSIVPKESREDCGSHWSQLEHTEEITRMKQYPQMQEQKACCIKPKKT